MSIEFFKAGLGVTNEVSAKLNNTFARSASHQTDLLFEDIWGRKHPQKQEKYSKADYERYGFSSQRKAMAFVAEMQKIGVEVAVAPVKLNGQVLVELHKNNDNVLKLDALDEHSEEQNTEQTAPVATESYTASQLVEWYKQETFEDVQAPAVHEAVATPQSTVRQEANALKNFVTQNLDLMGVAINRVSSGYETLKGRDVGSETMRKSDKRLFNQELRTTVDKDGNEIREVGSQRLKGNLGKAKKAIVIDNVVIIDGQKLAPDSKQYQYVMKQHKARLEKADVHIQRANSHINRVNTMNNVSHSVNNVMQQTAAYKAVNKGGEALHNVKESAKKLKHNAKESVKSLIHNGSFSDRFAETELGVPRYTKKEYQKNEYSHLQIHDKQEAVKVETRRKNAEAVKDGKIQEYVSSETVSRALRKGGYLDEVRNILNSQAIINQTIGAGSIGIALSAVNDAKTRAITNADFFDKMRNLHNTGNLPESLRKAISDAIEKVDIDGLDAGDVGKALRKEVEKHTNIEVDKISENNKIDISLVDNKPEYIDTNKILESLDKNFGKELGIDFIKGGITRENLLAVNLKVVQNSKKLNINLVTRSGGLDTKLLSKLNTNQLAELGLDKKTTALIIKLNEKGAWGGIDFGEFAGFASMAMRFTNKLAQDEDMQKMTRAAMQTADYSKRAVSTARQVSKASVEGVEAAKARLARMGQKLGIEPKKPKTPKDKSAKAVKNAKPFDEKKVAKFEKTQTHRAKKLAKSEKGIFAKAKKVADTTKKIVLEKLLPLILKFLVILLIVIVILSCLIVIVVLVVSLIQSLFNWNPFQAETYKDTVCYHLYSKMEELEESWREEVEDVDMDLSSPVTLLARFGVDNEPIDVYLQNHEELAYDNGKIYINPFSAKAGVGTIADYTEVSNFNGKRTFAYSANINKYGEKVAIDENGLYTATESGHTSNIKDIIGMVDTMFKFDVDGMDDDSMQSILGMTPKGMDFENLKNKFKVVLKNIGTFFKKLFGGDEAEDLVYLKMPNDLKYDAVASYAVELYGGSHQQLYTFDVSFHPVGKVQINVEGSVEELVVPEYEAAALGICNTPVQNNFKLMLSGNDIVPYVTDTAGLKHNLNTDTFDIRLALDNGTYIDNDQCLWDGMDDDETTLSAIQSYMNANGSNSCWQLETIENGKTYSDTILGYNVSGGWFENEQQAFEDAHYHLDNAWNAWNFTSTQTLNWNSDYDTLFSRDYVEKYDYRDDEVVKVNTESRTYDVWNSSGNYYYIVPSYMSFTWVNSSYPTQNADWGWSGSLGSNITFYYKNNAGRYAIFSWLNANGYASRSSENNFADIDGTVYYVEEGSNVPKTEYRCTVKAPFKISKTDRYTRSCKGHTFEYCGGHINLHSQGIVYSITNEQLSIGGMLGELQIPVVEGFDMEAYGYAPMIGKVNAKTLSYSNVSTAASTGGCVSASSSPQGSDIAHRGLNLYTGGEGDEATWKKGTDVRNDVDMYQFRDIFDCDCAIDKGCDVFPVDKKKGYKDYEGWTADNMMFAAMKSSGDWNELYEFDIPTEIAGQTLSQEDIENIILGLEGTYGSSFTDTRKDAVRLALNWVGKAHYSESHSDHAFLSKVCDSKKYDASCTATDDEGFIRYILYKGGKITDAVNSYLGFGVKVKNYGASNLLPADMLKHHGEGHYDEMVINASEYTYIESGGLTGFEDLSFSDAVRAFNEESYVIYLGKVSSDITLSGSSQWEKEKDKEPFVIKAGTTLTVDISDFDGAGSVKLRAKDSSGYTDICLGTLDKKKMFGSKTYYWVTNPDNYTYVHKYE